MVPRRVRRVRGACPVPDSLTRCSTWAGLTAPPRSPISGSSCSRSAGSTACTTRAVAERPSESPNDLLDVPVAQIESWGHLIFKPPRHGAATPWHQDEAYWDTNLDYHAVGAWVPLDDVDVDNGCLWFLPGSHRGEVLPHRHLGDDPTVHILEVVEPVDTSTAGSHSDPRGRRELPPPADVALTRTPTRPNGIGGRGRNEYQTVPVERAVPADRPWVDEGSQALTRHLHGGALVIDPASNPAVIDTTPRLPRHDVREPDRRARRRRSGARRTQGCAEPAAGAGRTGRARRHRGPGRDPPHLDDVPAGAPRADARALPRGVLRRRRRAEHLGAVPRLLRAAPRAPGRVPLGAHRGARRARVQQLRARCRSPTARASSS